MPQFDLSLVVSVFNEEEVLVPFWGKLRSVLNTLGCRYEVIFVNDGSFDSSYSFLKQIAVAENNVKVLNLSRNFGHEAAMLAGIDHSCGAAVICMDADLQHPPSLIPAMLAEYQAGMRIVHMVRKDNVGLGWYKKIATRIFYTVLNVLSPQSFVANASDFFLLDHRLCTVLRHEYRERTRFLRGIIQTLGFSKVSIDFVAPQRKAGRSKYALLQLCSFSLSAIISFSSLPLRLASVFGIIFGCFAVVVGVYSIIMKMLGSVISGYTTIVVMISFLFAIQLFVLGIIGEYIGFIFEEVKRRPIYLVESCFEKDTHVTS